MKLDFSQKLAIEGGPKAKQTPFAPRKRHGELDKLYLNEVIDSDILFFYLGTKVRAFEKRFAKMYGKKHCIACSSGTAAVHIAIAALELTPGSEVITSAITDMGSLTGILYQGLIPVFADVDAPTLNLSAESGSVLSVGCCGNGYSTFPRSSDFSFLAVARSLSACIICCHNKLR